MTACGISFSSDPAAKCQGCTLDGQCLSKFTQCQGMACGECLREGPPPQHYGVAEPGQSCDAGTECLFGSACTNLDLGTWGGYESPICLRLCIPDGGGREVKDAGDRPGCPDGFECRFHFPYDYWCARPPDAGW